MPPRRADIAPRIARVLALQPRMSPAGLAEPTMGTQDPTVLAAMTNLVRVWAYGNRLVPADFAEKATVADVSRQPVVYAAVDLQRVERRAETIFRPLPPGGPVDATEWATDDLFALVPVAPPRFAEGEQTHRTALPGRELPMQCTHCHGAGTTTCRHCTSGRLPCSNCGGALRRTCPHCAGAGTHLGVSGRMVRCRYCTGQGSIPCTQCEGRGTVTCPECLGNAQIECDPCAGHGNVVRGQELIEILRTDHRHATLAEKCWADFDRGFAASDVVVERVYPTADPPTVRLDDLAPAAVQAHAEKLLRETLAAHAAARRSGESKDRVTAARVRLHGLYAYDVTVRYEGRPYRLVVTAAGTQIVPRKLPPARRGPLAWVVRQFRRYLRALQTDATPGPQAAFVRAVREGQAHLSDEQCLIPQAVARLGGRFVVTEAGYHCDLPEALADGPSQTVPLEVRFDLDERDRPTLRVDADLGPAHRDRYVRLLAACHVLPVGRLAVVDAGDGTERLTLADRRPYSTADAENYADVLRLLALAARRLREETNLF